MGETSTALRAMSAAEVQQVVGEPVELVQLKVQSALDHHCRAFIERSPFVALGTVSADGRADVSPRGDPAGFVHVLDDQTLAIPERPGNKLADSLTNVLETGRVGLLFIVPGVEETLRVNGKGTITDDAELLEKMAVKGKTPKLAIVLNVEEAFVHCAKAFRRSSLWDPEKHVERSELPSIGQMIRDQVKPPDLGAEEIEEFAQEDYRTRMY
ncbi:MAG: pyridoxamine 5'-phosphate oxidase family protein [Gaiellaceae bacterium]